MQGMSSPTANLDSLDPFPERRFYPRTAPTRPVYVPFGGSNLAMLLNLSENGLLVSTPVGLDLNSVFRVAIRLNGLPKAIDVHVRTIWTNESKKRAGIQLLDLSDHDREQIRKWSALEASRGKSDAAARSVERAVEAVRPAGAEKLAPFPATTPNALANLPRNPEIPAYLAPMPAATAFPAASSSLDFRPRPVAIVAPNARRKSPFPAMVAWGAVGAVLTLAAALFLDRGFAQELLKRPGVNPVEINAPAPDSSAVSNSSALYKVTQSTLVGSTVSEDGHATIAAKPTYRGAIARLEDQADAALAAPKTLAGQSTLQAIDGLDSTKRAKHTTDDPVEAKSITAISSTAPSSSMSSVPAPATSALDATASSKTSATSMPAANLPAKPAATSPVATPATAQPSTLVPTAAPSATSNSFPPATSAASMQTSGSSAITGAFGTFPKASPADPNASNGASNSAPTSTWPPSGAPIAAGKARNSLFHSRLSSFADSPVVQMDTNPGPAMAITPPRGIGFSFVTIPGERVIDSPGMTVHIRRAVRVPAEHWIWRNRKQVALGELASRIDPPQAAHQPVAGAITVQAMIDKDGRIIDLKPLNGSFSFLPSVTRAVHEWRYEPTYLDGKPVETRAEIEIDFHGPAAAYHP
jgi:Gram-negative bacterial TonB protein C-terminal/PilZ domain